MESEGGGLEAMERRMKRIKNDGRIRGGLKRRNMNTNSFHITCPFTSNSILTNIKNSAFFNTTRLPVMDFDRTFPYFVIFSFFLNDIFFYERIFN